MKSKRFRDRARMGGATRTSNCLSAATFLLQLQDNINKKKRGKKRKEKKEHQ